MKNLFIYISLSLLFISIESAFCRDIEQYLEAYWSFDDSTAKDVSGHGHHGTIMNSPKPIKGVRGIAFWFQGRGINESTGDHILLPRINFESFGSFTIIIWVFEHDMSCDAGESYIEFGDHNKGWLGIMNITGKRTSGNALYNHFATGAIFDQSIEPLKIQYDLNLRDRWVQYCLVYNSGIMKAYREGKYLGQQAQNIYIYNNNGALARHWWESGSITSTRYIGALDEVKIYRIALTDDEIKKSSDTCSVSAKIVCNNTICEGDTLYLYSNITGTSNFSWSGPNGFSSNLRNPIIPNVTKVNAGKYILKADSATCLATDTIIVTVDHVIAKIRCNNELCEGDTLFLNSLITGTSTFSWKGPDNFSSNSQNPIIPNITKIKSGTYYLIANSSGCSVIDSIKVSVKRKINTKITSNTPLCYGDVAFLFVPSDTSFSYKWTGPNSFSSNQPYIMIPNFSQNQSGLYKVEIYASDLCPFSDSVMIIGSQKVKFVFQLPDTSGIAGTTDFYIPLIILTDAVIYPITLKSVKAVISIKNDAYNLKDITIGSYSLAIKDSFNIISIDLGDIIINSSVQTITEIKGDLLSDKILSPVILNSIEFPKDTCQTKYLKNGSLRIICDISEYDHNNFKDMDDISLTGQAIGRIDDYLRLAQSKNYQSAAMWYKTPIPIVNGFTSRFSFRFSNGSNNGNDDGSLPGADGIAFVIQNNDINQIGLSGGGIGYDGIPNSLAIEFDTYSNDSTQIENFFDPNGNHAAVQSNGKKPNTAKHLKTSNLALNDKIFTLRSDGTIYYVKIEYNISPNTLKIYLDSSDKFSQPPCIVIDKFDISKLFDLIEGCKAYIGITSATGVAWQNHDILSWETCPKPCGSQINDVENKWFQKEDNEIKIYPNPFSNQINFEFSLQNESYASIKIYDIFGNEISNIITNKLDPGAYNYMWKPELIEKGIYICKIYLGNKLFIFKTIYKD